MFCFLVMISLLSYSDLMSLLLKPWNIPWFLFIFLLLFHLRQTNYAQKPWRIRWTQCGMKRWCIMASQQPTWPPKHSGRCSALYFTQTAISSIPQTAKRPVCYAEEKIHASSRSELPVAIYASQWDFPDHYCIWVTPANCSTCLTAQVLTVQLVSAPLLPTEHSTWSDWGQV